MSPIKFGWAVGCATLFLASASHAALTVCASGYITKFTASASQGGHAIPNMTITIGGKSWTIGKDDETPAATASWDTIRSAAQAAFLAQTPVQLTSTASCTTTSSGAAPYAINMCLNASDCGVSSAGSGAVSATQSGN